MMTKKKTLLLPMMMTKKKTMMTMKKAMLFKFQTLTGYDTLPPIDQVV